jgi:hypothetical protein
MFSVKSFGTQTIHSGKVNLTGQVLVLATRNNLLRNKIRALYSRIQEGKRRNQLLKRANHILKEEKKAVSKIFSPAQLKKLPVGPPMTLPRRSQLLQ